MVEYESKMEYHPSIIIGSTTLGGVTRISGSKYLGDFLKINSDNTINIKSVKDSCKEEIIKVLKKYNEENNTLFLDDDKKTVLNKWIEKNL